MVIYSSAFCVVYNNLITLLMFCFPVSVFPILYSLSIFFFFGFPCMILLSHYLPSFLFTFICIYLPLFTTRDPFSVLHFTFGIYFFLSHFTTHLFIHSLHLFPSSCFFPVFAFSFQCPSTRHLHTSLCYLVFLVLLITLHLLSSLPGKRSL